jgi:hypothetical protein
VNDLYPFWNASRAILHGIDPYSPEITEQNQISAYGVTAKVFGSPDEQHFAYPVYATFPFIFLGLVGSETAKQIAFSLFVALIALSVGWLRAKWDWDTALYCALTFASYPVIYALQAYQPTLLFLCLAVGALALLRSGHLVLAGMVAALATGKPHIALSTLLPMLIWTFARWHERKRFAIAFGVSLLGLTWLASLVTPGWIFEWLAVLRAYSQYIHPSFIAGVFGRKIGSVIAIALLVGLTSVLWRHRHGDLLFQAAVTAPIVYLLTPFVLYNAVLLLIPAVWIADNAHFIENCGATCQLTLGLVRVSFAGLWLAAPIGALLLHTTQLGKAVAWEFPGIMVSPLLISIVAVMVVQCFTSQPTIRNDAHCRP